MYNNGVIGNIPTSIHYPKILSISHYLFFYKGRGTHSFYHITRKHGFYDCNSSRKVVVKGVVTTMLRLIPDVGNP